MHAHTLEALKNNLKKGAKVLDIGFGSGYIVIYFLNFFFDCKQCAAFAEVIGKTGKVYGIDHIEGIK